MDEFKNQNQIRKSFIAKYVYTHTHTQGICLDVTDSSSAEESTDCSIGSDKTILS